MDEAHSIKKTYPFAENQLRIFVIVSDGIIMMLAFFFFCPDYPPYHLFSVCVVFNYCFSFKLMTVRFTFQTRMSDFRVPMCDTPIIIIVNSRFLLRNNLLVTHNVLVCVRVFFVAF